MLTGATSAIAHTVSALTPSRRRFVHLARMRSPNVSLAHCAESVDHMIVLDERHLALVLTEFVRYHNHERPHRTLGLRAPEVTPQ